MQKLLHGLSPRSAGIIGALLAAPALLFVSASILKYELGAPFLYDNLGFLASPGKLPVYAGLSPLIFLGGTFVALALNLVPLLRVEMRRDADEIVVTGRLRPHGLNLTVVAAAALVLVTLLGYLVVENIGHA